MGAHTQVRLCERLYDMSQTVDLTIVSPKVEDAGSPRLYLDKVSVNHALKRYAISIASAEYLCSRSPILTVLQ
jgi:hypothetical protein